MGTNIVAVLPGTYWGTPNDKVVIGMSAELILPLFLSLSSYLFSYCIQVLVVGAHWDTVTNTGGLDDNGSGVAAMLELGKLLVTS